jgi:hypothetical protein
MAFERLTELGYKALQVVADNAVLADSAIGIGSSYTFLQEASKGNAPVAMVYILLTILSMGSANASFGLEMKLRKQTYSARP